MQFLGRAFTTDPVSQFPFPKVHVIEIEAKTKVNEAFRVLIQNNLLSAPVYDANRKEYLGFFEVQDAIRFAAVEFETLFLGTENEQTLHEVGEMLKRLVATSEIKHAPWVPVSPSTPMSEVIRLLAKVRRVPVVDPKTMRVTKVISQSLICQQIAETLSQMSEIPDLFKRKGGDVKGCVKPVVTVPEDTPARVAFQVMMDKNISAIGITDDEDKLFTCLTAKDIRLLPVVDKADDAAKQVEGEDEVAHDLLSLSVIDFVAKARLIGERKGKARPALVVTHVDTEVHHMIARLAKTNMHRLFLVDEDHKAVGVFSVADAVNLLVID